MDSQGQQLPDKDKESDGLPSSPSPASINTGFIHPSHHRDTNLDSLQAGDKEAAAQVNGPEESVYYTHTRERKADMYVRNGNVLIGEEARVAKAFHAIQEVKVSKNYTITLKHPESNSSHSSDDPNDSDVDMLQERDLLNKTEAKHSSLTSQCDKEQSMNPPEIAEENSVLSEEVDTDQEHSQNELEGDINACSTNEPDSQPSEYVKSSEDSDNNQCYSIQLGIEPDSRSECDNSDDEIDWHVELVQDTTDLDSGSEGESDSENDIDIEDIDVHRSVKQSSKVVKVTYNEHTRSKLTSSREGLEHKTIKSVGEVKVASTDGKLVNEKITYLTSETKCIGGDIKVAAADAKVVDTNLKVGTVVTKVEGAELKLASADAKGLSVQAGATHNMTTKVSTTTVASAELVGAKVDAQSTSDLTAQGVFSKVGTATATGVQNKVKASAKTTCSGAKVQTGVANLTGVKTGASAEASAEATGTEVTIGTFQGSGVELTATATASASVGTKLNVATVSASGFDGVGARASVEAKSGLNLLNFNTGVSGNVGVHVSTTPSVGCVEIGIGLPKLGIGSGFANFSLGGGVEGESGRYVGAATVGDSKGSSKNGNGSGGSNGSSSGTHGGDTMGNMEGNTIKTSPGDGHGSTSVQSGVEHASGPFPLQGSVDALSGTSHIIGPVSGRILISNDKSVDGHHLSVGMTNALDIHSKAQHKANPSENNGGVTNGGVSLSVDLSEQPLHIRALHTIEQQHFSKQRDKQNKIQQADNSASNPAALSGQKSIPHTPDDVQTNVPTSVPILGQLSPNLAIKAIGGGAKLQALVNEHYPLLPGEGTGKKKASQELNRDWDIEQVKKSAISRLTKSRNTSTRRSASAVSSNSTANNHSIREKKKPFGSRNHIHTLDCIVDSSSKDVVQINSDSSGKVIAGFKDMMPE